MYFTISLALVLFGCVFIEALKVSCKNEASEDVDWYYLYKLPKHYSNEINSDLSGLRYTYLTSETIKTKNWQLSDIRIDNSTSFPGQTLSDLFNDPDVLLIAYNDEVPDGPTDFENGHTKGVVATDGIHALWLVHSVPKYPSISGYTYPTTGEHFGQSFLCVTLNATTQMNAVITQLLFNEPNIYFSRIPERLSKSYPDLGRVIAKQWRSSAPFQNLLKLKSLNGNIFQSFAKGRYSNVELYKDWVAPILDVDLMVESWRNGPGKLPSDCSTKDKVYNIAMIDDHEISFSFKSTMDHSKWAVSKMGENEWICIGDINRSEHQLLRGGGTVCQKNTKLAQMYRNSIKSFENCTNNGLSNL
ncbi:deoxyribonuclease-2-beta [Episyrphus balteatus]|uniref:deoxyribonuclease-2-beta n=1 Tax=Episyrphus balteatus TaxID=286459 RepID=UPI002485B0B0|nr:deoxyribonuclease-2-beta [Episyrphus balteatus]